MKAATIAWICTVAAALGIGFVAGRGSGFSQAATDTPSFSPESKSVKVADRPGFADSAVMADDAAPRGSAFAGTKPAQEKLASILGIADPRTRDRQIENILSATGLSGVKKAIEWAEALPDSAGKRALLAGLMERWGQLEGPAAAAYGEKQMAETGNVNALRDALKGWGMASPQSALQYAQGAGVSDGLRREAMRDVLRDWADRDPQAAAAYALGNDLQLGRGGPSRLIADRWSQQDPLAASNWAMTLPDGPEQRMAIDQSIGNWASQNLQAAANYVNNQPAGPVKDVMVSRLAREIATQDPSAALHWTASLSDTGMQARTAMGIVMRTSGHDLAAATQILENSPLAPEVRQQILTRISNPNRNPWNRGGGGPPR